MKKPIVLSLFILCSAFSFHAQNKLLSIDDIFSTDDARRVRFNGSPVAVQWAGDGKSFRQLINGRLMRVDALTGQAEPYFNTAALSGALYRSGVHGDDADRIANSPTTKFNADESAIVISNANDLWYYDVKTAQLKRLTNTNEEEKEADFSPDGRWVSFVRGNNLFVVDVAKGGEKQLTRDGREGIKPIYNGYLDWVYEEELYGRGLKRGYWWSPDSKNIAFLRLDETPVPRFVLPNDVNSPQVVENTDYPRAGEPNPFVRVGIADVAKTSLLPNPARIPKIGERLPPSLQRVGDAAKFVDLSAYKPEDTLIGRVAWTPDSQTVILQVLNREQTNMDIVSADADSRIAKKLFNESTPAWVNVYGNPVFLKNGSFVWESARNGWKHLYHYEANGNLVRALTTGRWEVRTFYGIDEKGRWAYFSSTKDSAIAENIYRVSLNGGEVQRLTRTDGWHAAQFNRDFTYFVDNFSDVTTPVQAALYRADGVKTRTIQENRVDALRDYRLSKPEFLNVQTRDGFAMEAMMIKPPDFDPSKKYPVFEFTYAGVHSPSVLDRWAGTRGMWFQMLAQKGYIIWVLDNRTASGKGEESAWPAYKRSGELELRDLEDGVNYLKSLPYVDGSRIGLYGWSNGGFMTSYALTHSKSFKIGIAGGTVSDWRLYDSIFTDRIMQTPQNNPDGYERSSVIKAAKNLSGRLLLIHGAMDDNVHMQNTTQLAYALQQADKQFDLMIYPTQRHGFTNSAQIKHWYTLMTDFILKNL